MTQLPLATPAKFRDRKDDRLLPHQIRRQRLTTGEKNPQTNQAIEMKAFQTKKSEIPCRCRNCSNPSCVFWHPPVCQKYKSKTGCTFCNKCFFPTCQGGGEAQQEVKEGCCERSACRGGWENVISGKQMDDSVQEETLAVSAAGIIVENKHSRLLLHQKRRHRLTETNHQKVQVSEVKVLLEKEAELRADISLRRKFTNPLCDYWHPLVCQIENMNQDANTARKVDSGTLWLVGSPAKSRRKVV